MPLFHVTAEQGCSAIAVAIEADDRNDAINNFRDAHPLERNWKIKAVAVVDAGERREAREQRLAATADNNQEHRSMPSQAFNDHFERNFRPVAQPPERLEHAAGSAIFEIVTVHYPEDRYLAGVLHVRQGWHFYFSARAPGGENLVSVVRGPFPDEDSAMIAASAELEAGNQADEELAAGLKRDRDQLLAQRVQTAGHGRRARIQAEIDKLERELERLDAID